MPAGFYIPYFKAQEFDGNGVELDGLSVDIPGNNYLGLFGTVDTGSTIKDIDLSNAQVNGWYAIGSLAGVLTGSAVEYATSTGTVAADVSVGGLIGIVDQSSRVSTSSASVDVTGRSVEGNASERVGGFAGESSGLINGTRATGSVSGHVGDPSSGEFGGFVGRNRGTITGSYALGDVTESGGGDNIRYGGFAGSEEGPVYDSYSTGTVRASGTGDEALGGFAGYIFSGPVVRSHATGDVISSGDTVDSLGGFAGGINSGTTTDSYSTGDVVSNGGAGSSSMGGFAGYSYGDIVDSYATGNVTAAGDAYNLGGFVGFSDARIVDSAATGDVTGNAVLGGFIGDCARFTPYQMLSSVSATGNVTARGADSAKVGGLVGQLDCGIQNAFAHGDVSLDHSATGAPQFFGGLVGNMTDIGSVLDSYASGDVRAGIATDVGGLIGHLDSGGSNAVTNSFSQGSVAGASLVGGFIGSNDSNALSNDAWFVGAAENAVGGGLDNGVAHRLSSLSYGTDETNVFALDSTSHAVYAFGGTSPWDFSSVWTSFGAVPPLLRSMPIGSIASHTVTISAGQGGSADLSGVETVGDGSDLTLSFTPESGYSISGVSIDGTSVGAIASYTLSDIVADHVVSVSFSRNAVAPTGTTARSSGRSVQSRIRNLAAAGNLAAVDQLKAQYPYLLPVAATAVSGAPRFGRDLQKGSSGADVLALQKYLNSAGFEVASSGPGSLGHETDFFGAATRAALAKFQKAKGISPALGYFGPKTREYIESR